MIKKRFVGSKGGQGVSQRIISEMPPHDVYIEAFLGTGVLMRRKRPALVNIGIDKDPLAPGFDLCSETLRDRFAAVQGDCMKWLRNRRWKAGDLVYLDPPYLMETRAQQRLYYAAEMGGEFGNEDDHRMLIETIRAIPPEVAIMVSGYRSGMYDEALSDWRRVDIPSVNRGGDSVTESVWCNFDEPTRLHDCSYVGRDYTERQRIQRKRARWLKKFTSIPVRERQVIYEAIREEWEFTA